MRDETLHSRAQYCAVTVSNHAKLSRMWQGGVMDIRQAKYGLGDVVRHRLFPFRGVVVDVDPEFANTEEWYEAIPEDIRPPKDQPFYHLLAENDESYYGAYVSEGNLLPDAQNGPVSHPEIQEAFDDFDGQRYPLRPEDARPN